MEESEEALSLAEMGSRVEKLNVPCHCERYIFKASDIEHYGPHSGGVEVKGFSEKQWVYFNCKACGYDMALWKVLRRAEAVKSNPEIMDATKRNIGNR